MIVTIMSKKHFHFFFISYICFYCMFNHVTLGAEEDHNKHMVLSIREIDIGNKSLKIAVEIENKNSETIFLIKPMRHYASSALSFYFKDTSGARLRIYYRGPSAESDMKIPRLSIQPHSKHTIEVDLLDGRWVWPTALGLGHYDTVVAELDFPQGEKGSFASIHWSGHLESNVLHLSKPLKEIFYRKSQSTFWEVIWEDLFDNIDS